MSDYMRSRKGEEGEGFFCRFTFGQFFALLVLEVFTLFFVFYLGARYGREFLGLAKTAQVAADAPAASPADEEPKVATTADPEAARMARELIAKADTPELKERIARMFENAKQGGGPRTPPVVSRNHAKEEGAGGQAAAKKPAEDTAEPGSGEAVEDAGPARPPSAGPPSAGPPPARSPDAQAAAEAGERRLGDDRAPGSDATADKSGATDSSVIRVKSAEHGRYSVQIGSYPQMGEATRVVDKWKDKGYSAYMMIADIPDRGRWYRVRIGSFASHDDAARYLKDFQSRENVEALIVMNEQ